MDKPQADRERRKQRRFEQMGTNDPICLTCRYTQWHNFHGHHIAGKRYDPDAIEYFDTRCHGDLSEEQRDHPPPISKSRKPSHAECAAHYGFGLADIWQAAAPMIAEYGNRFLEVEKQLYGLPNSDEARSLMREAGHYFTALAAFQDRAGDRLRWHQNRVIDESRKSASRTKAKRKRQHRRGSAAR